MRFINMHYNKNCAMNSNMLYDEHLKLKIDFNLAKLSS